VQAIDDGPTPTANEGSWVSSSVGYNGGQQIGSSTTFSRATATWKAPTLPAGTYAVYATWAPLTNGLTTEPYTITKTDATGASQTTTSAPMNFRLAPGGLDYDSAKWTQIGTVTSTGTETVSVTLSTGSTKSGTIPADAILFKPTGLDVARTTYEWDHQNRLTKVTNESAAFAATGAATLSPRDTTDYAYDVLGRRAAVTYDLVGPADGGGDFRRVSVYDGSQVVWTETGTNREQMVSQGTTQAMLWAPGTDQLLAIQERLGGTGAVKQPVWTLTDHQGTVKDYLAKAPTAGAESGLLLTRRYSAFGAPLSAKQWNNVPTGGTSFTDISGKSGFFYVGQEYDATTGLQYSRARYYDPVSSEFISQDPLGFAGGDTNLYRRAGNSPANATDPSGLAWGWAAAGIGAGVSVAGYTIGTLGYSIWTGQNQFSTGGFVGAAAGGAVAGLVVGALTGDVTSVAGLVGVSALAGGAGGLASGAVGTLTDQTVQSALTGTNQYNLTAVGQNALSEGVTGLVGGAIGGAGLAAINARMFAVAFGKSAVAREAAQGVAGFAGGFVGDQTSQLSAIAVGSQNPADYSASRSLRAGAIGAGIAVGVGRAGAAWRAWASNAASSASRGLTTPNKYFSNKTYAQIEEALTSKFGPPLGQGPYNKSFYDPRSKRTFNLHHDPSHRRGLPHIDIRKRGLPTDYYKDRPFFLLDN
jgi:RHS repeat-associated protein